MDIPDLGSGDISSAKEGRYAISKKTMSADAISASSAAAMLEESNQKWMLFQNWRSTEPKLEPTHTDIIHGTIDETAFAIAQFALSDSEDV